MLLKMTDYNAKVTSIEGKLVLVALLKKIMNIIPKFI